MICNSKGSISVIIAGPFPSSYVRININIEAWIDFQLGVIGYTIQISLVEKLQ